MPAPAARIRSARLPCGTSSSSILPARYRASNTWESDWRGNEHTIFLTRPAANRAARPVSPLPALLLTMTRSLAPWSSRASISSRGWPARPKPPTMMEAPSGTSARAWRALSKILEIMPFPACEYDHESQMAGFKRPAIVDCAPGLVDGGARSLDHLGPAFDFGFDEIAEFSRRGLGRHRTQIGQALLHVGLGQGSQYDGVEFLDHVVRRALGRDHAEPGGHVEIRVARFFHRGQV